MRHNDLRKRLLLTVFLFLLLLAAVYSPLNRRSVGAPALQPEQRALILTTATWAGGLE